MIKSRQQSRILAKEAEYTAAIQMVRPIDQGPFLRGAAEEV
jgi:hypothetical protein